MLVIGTAFAPSDHPSEIRPVFHKPLHAFEEPRESLDSFFLQYFDRYDWQQTNQ
jgi:hypothetical protein